MIKKKFVPIVLCIYGRSQEDKSKLKLISSKNKKMSEIAISSSMDKKRAILLTVPSNTEHITKQPSTISSIEGHPVGTFFISVSISKIFKWKNRFQKQSLQSV